jgi:NAD(P)-dependent dehydrogenase (short-subunit alcohol dehydrogenase family)
VTDRQVVLLTGASRGIGAHAATWLARGGADLALVARDAESLARVSSDARQLGVDVLELPTDVTEVGAGQRAVAATLNRFGRIDSLVNNAGIAGPVGHIVTLDLQDWRRTLETNLLAAVAFIQAAAPELRRQAGIVVNVTSEVADIASESIEPYAGTKAALRHLTRTLADEEPDLTVVSYDPGPCNTELMAEIRNQATTTMRPQLAAAYHDLHDSGGLIQPHDTARVLAWLATSTPKAWSSRVVNHADTDAKTAAQHALPNP